MPSPILTTSSTVMCTHGGSATLQPGTPLVQVQGANALLESEIHSVAGCPLTIPGKGPQPCTTIRWSLGGMQTKVNQIGVLLQTSIGICYSSEQIPQGTAIVAQVQAVAQGT